MAELQARFEVTGWDDIDLPDLDPGWLGAVRMRKHFTSGIEGSSVALFVSSGEIDGQRAYFAAERITGTVGSGPSGTVTVHHGGLESFPDRWFGHVVPGSGTGSFESWTGTTRIEHDEGGAYFVFQQ